MKVYIYIYTPNFKKKNHFKHWYFWATYQHIRMISEGSCDTESGSNDAEISASASEE